MWITQALFVKHVDSCVSMRKYFIFFSATDALKGEGLQEGVDWLQGTTVKM